MPNTKIFLTISRRAETWNAGESPYHAFGYQKNKINVRSFRRQQILINQNFRYGLYDFEYEHQCQGTTESSKKQKLFLMSWCPDRYRTTDLASVVNNLLLCFSAPRSRRKCCTRLHLMHSKNPS